MSSGTRRKREQGRNPLLERVLACVTSTLCLWHLSKQGMRGQMLT